MKMRGKMQNEKGFTLVELMVVVVILGILVAIAVPVYKNITEKAAIKAHDANVRTLIGAATTAVASEDLPTAEVTWNSKDSAGTGDDVYKASDYLQEWPVPPGVLTVTGGKLAGKTAYEVKISPLGVITCDPTFLNE